MNLPFKVYAAQYKKALLEDIIPFWLEHSADQTHGGYFTCLDRQGAIYDTDKFVSLQGQQVWAFSMLYNLLDKNPAWLEMAGQGARFLLKHGQDKDGNWYFALDRQGSPLLQPYDILSDFYAAMGFSQYSIACGDALAKSIAIRSYDIILSRKDNPQGKYNRFYPNTRTLKNFVIPKLLCNLTLEMQDLLDPIVVERSLDICLHEVLEIFLDTQKNVIYENVFPDGSHAHSIDGRLIIPGNGLEAMWFAMEIGVRRNDQVLIDMATQVTVDTLAYAWDQEYGGIFYMMDAENCPLQQPEWDHKLWWVHLEALISLTRGYMLTGNAACLPWIKKVHEFTWEHFPDSQHGEWFAYLNRMGQPQTSLKGGRQKGFFHLPRALYKCWQNFENIANMEDGKKE